jgi:hypothetical protein
MADLATDDETWQRWQGTMPVIVDVVPGAGNAERTVRPNGAVEAVS